MTCGHLTLAGGKCKNTKGSCRYHSKTHKSTVRKSPNLRMQMKGVSEEVKALIRTRAQGNEDVVDEIIKRTGTDEVEIFFDTCDVPWIRGHILYNGKRYPFIDNLEESLYRRGYEYINSILSRVQNIVNNYPENKTYAFGRLGKILWKYSSIGGYKAAIGRIRMRMTIQIIVFIKDEDSGFPSVDGKPFKFIFEG